MRRQGITGEGEVVGPRFCRAGEAGAEPAAAAEESLEKPAAAPSSISIVGAFGGGRRVGPTTASNSGGATPEVEKVFPNGDVYRGGFTGNAPHDRGSYLWADGCMYEGEWRKGKAAGKGKFSWPSGASYEGEFKGGRMEGFGTFIGADGDTYRGSWIADRKHGGGSRSYANGDFYEGQWRRNLPDGQGHYVWRNGNQFVGEWRNGVISGQGVFIGANGNRYDSQWENGVPKGRGIFTSPDGTCYIGSWNKDAKSQQPTSVTAGKGKRSPFSSPEDGTPSFLSSMQRFSVEGGVTEKKFPRVCIWESNGDAGDITCDIIDTLEAMLYKDGSEFGQGGEAAVSSCSHSCFYAGEVKKLGQTVSKGHKNYDLILNLQLGIRYSVCKSGSKQLRELRPSDFDPREKFWTRFPPEGSKNTQPHQSVEFKWKDYCPMVFRHLRKLFAVDPVDYVRAIGGNETLRELSSPGKSGSLFFLTQGDRFIIKTVKKSEVKVLIRMLSSYYEHVSKYENSLVTKFYGVHCVKPTSRQKVRFIVMGNLFCTEYRIHRRFDLKGSSHGRTIHKAEEEMEETATLKDLDLNYVFHLEKLLFKKLMWQIDQDCKLLETEGIMDYSLLVGVHFIDDVSASNMGICAASEKMPVMHESFKVKGPMVDFCFPDSGWRDTARFIDGRKPLVQLGASMPAKAEHVFLRANSNHIPDGAGGLVTPTGSGEIHKVILYFGIIDILRDYDISKKLERAYKSLQADPTSISAVDPKLYSRRFRDFIGRVFVEDD